MTVQKVCSKCGYVCSSKIYEATLFKDGNVCYMCTESEKRSIRARSQETKQLRIQGKRRCSKCDCIKQISSSFAFSGALVCNECSKRGVCFIASEKDKRSESVLEAIKSARCALATALRKEYGKVSREWLTVGCDHSHLLKHIELQFQDGMSWQNRSQWHIDHIIPLASAKTEEDVIRLNHYTNLRPLWAIDNLRKGAKLDFVL